MYGEGFFYISMFFFISTFAFGKDIALFLVHLQTHFFFFFFFKSFLADTCPFFWGHWYPCFWISGDVSLWVFKARVGFCLIRYFCGGECNVHSPRFTSGATLADLLAAGAQPVTSPHACAEVGLGSVSNVRSHEQKTNALPLCQRPGSIYRLIAFVQTNSIIWLCMHKSTL